MSLYAVLETSVIEIARLLQRAQKQGIGINDLRGDFLDRAKKYYKNLLQFDLCSDVNAWQRIKILADVRHTIAHANGRLDMANDKIKRKMKALEKRNLGISSYYNYLLIDSEFAKETFSQVRLLLEDLVDRYKEWDTKQKSA
ncbi:MAG: hypothetical protein HWN69_01930 [Desulfobacterales bacterium]|nr:hypothetical protein [Desulfobacterales bacterium]